MRATDFSIEICRSLREFLFYDPQPPAYAGGFMLSLAYASLEPRVTASPITASPRHRVTPSPRRKLPADLHRTFDHIDVLEDLQTQVIVEVRIVGEKLVDDRERFR